MSETPPVAKYRLTVTITGNTLDEIEDRLVEQTRGGFLLDSDYRKRDAWDSTDGRTRSVMEHRNPVMTPEQYSDDLAAWFHASRRTNDAPTTDVRKRAAGDDD